MTGRTGWKNRAGQAAPGFSSRFSPKSNWVVELLRCSRRPAAWRWVLDTHWVEPNGAWPVRRLLFVTLCIVLAGLGACGQESIDSAYWPAMYTSEGTVSHDLEVFPPSSISFRIYLPFPLYTFTYSADGSSLYAADMNDVRALLDPRIPRKAGLFKIDLSSVHVAAVPGSGAFSFYEIAAGANGGDLLISGQQSSGCGIFRLNIRDGGARLIVRAPSCDPVHPWRDLSLSQDGRHATATLNQRLYLIDMMSGDAHILGAGAYSGGSWSPDGKWLAVTKAPQGNTVLLNSNTLKEEKTLPSTDLKWSPDSKYLLARTPELTCGFTEAQTLEVVNVSDGRKTRILSSRCQIDRTTLGWVNGQIVKR